MSNRNSVQFFQQSGLPVIQMTAGLWLRLWREPPTPHRLVQSRNLGLFMAVQRVRSVRGASFSQRRTPCEGSELGTVTLILKSECMLIFTVLLLLVEGLNVSAALSFNIAVVLVEYLVVVVNRCMRRVAIGIVLWPTVVGLSVWDVERVNGNRRCGG